MSNIGTKCRARASTRAGRGLRRIEADCARAGRQGFAAGGNTAAGLPEHEKGAGPVAFHPADQ